MKDHVNSLDLIVDIKTQLRKFGYDVNINNLSLDVINVLDWLRNKHNIVIETVVDGWVDDNCVSKEHLCFRIYIWQIGKPKPKPKNDIGAYYDLRIAYLLGIQHALNNLM